MTRVLGPDPEVAAVNVREIRLEHQTRLDHRLREPWQQWLNRHGFNTWVVSIPNHIRCDDDARTVEVDVFHSAGTPESISQLSESIHLLSECPDRAGPVSREDDDGCTRRHVVQLEAPALPFPEVTG